MPLSATRTPNATISFIPKLTPDVGSRHKLPDAHVLQPSAIPEVSRFDGPCLLRPVSFREAQPYGIESEGSDKSSGQIYAGFWRLKAGKSAPKWIKDGTECAIAFTEGKRMTGKYYAVTGRTEWAKSRQKGPDFILNTMRQN
jgi:hypothetical protein